MRVAGDCCPSRVAGARCDGAADEEVDRAGRVATGRSAGHDCLVEDGVADRDGAFGRPASINRSCDSLRVDLDDIEALEGLVGVGRASRVVQITRPHRPEAVVSYCQGPVRRCVVDGGG